MQTLEHEAGYHLNVDDRSVGRLTLNRPELHNAFDDRLIAALRDLFARLSIEQELRLLHLASEGPSFSAGADLNWMRHAAEQNEKANIEDAMQLEAMLRGLDELPFPVIAEIQGPAIGGGLGLVAAADIAVASEKAFFAASEVRLGIIPAIISPFVVRAIGARQARRYFLTAERLDANNALDLGLVHMVVKADDLRASVLNIEKDLLQGGPEAQAATKVLVREVAEIKGSLLGAFTSRMIAERRASDEGREGISAFLEKRKPAWLA